VRHGAEDAGKKRHGKLLGANVDQVTTAGSGRERGLAL